MVEGGDELIGAGDDFGALGVAAEADHDVGVAFDFEVAGAVADHDDGGGFEFGAESSGDLVLALSSAGRAGLIEAGVGAIGLKLEDHGFDARDAEEIGERADGLSEAPAYDDDCPAGGAELGERGDGGGLDRRDVESPDGFQFDLRRLDDVEPLGEDRLHGRAAVHGGIGHILDRLKRGRTAEAA